MLFLELFQELIIKILFFSILFLSIGFNIYQYYQLEDTEHKFHSVLLSSMSKNKNDCSDIKPKEIVKVVTKEKTIIQKVQEHIGYDFSTIIQDKLSSMDDETIIKTIKNYMRFDEKFIPSDMTTKEFANKLIEITMSENEEFYYDENHDAYNIAFTDKFDTNDTSKIMPKSKLDTNSSKIYAVFDTSNFKDDVVLAKWTTSDGEILAMDFYNVKQNSPDNFIWVSKKTPWKEGDYQIDVYSPNNKLKKIYSNYFVVE